MEYASIVSKIYEFVEADNVEGATLACLRLARLTKDHMQTLTFQRELFSDKHEVARTLHSDAPDLSAEQRKFIWEKSVDRWLEIHTMDFSFSKGSNGEDRNVLKVSVGEIESDLKRCQDILNSRSSRNSFSSSEHDIYIRMMALQTIKSRLKSRCFSYAIQIEKQIYLQDKNQAILWNVQNEVNNFFKD